MWLKFPSCLTSAASTAVRRHYLEGAQLLGHFSFVLPALPSQCRWHFLSTLHPSTLEIKLHGSAQGLPLTGPWGQALLANPEPCQKPGDAEQLRLVLWW